METRTFAEALSAEVATLMAQYPILAEAIERAHGLLTDGLVFPHEDGHSADVGSSSDPTSSYYVNGTCACKASQYSEVPCKHRLAFRLYQRVSTQLRAVAAAVVVPAPAPPACEVPAIMSTCIMIEGRQVEVKLCDTDDARLVARLTALLQQFPVAQPAPGTPAEGWCEVHGVQMRKNRGKDGKPDWFSHKAPDGDWCHGA